MTLSDQLYQKLSDEYKAFIDGLKSKTPDEILEAAYEKTFKEDIVYSFEIDGDYSDKEINVLLTVENPLDELYQNWLHTDVSYMNDLSDSISGFVVREIERRGGIANEEISKAETPDEPRASEPIKAAAQAINGKLQAGEYVIVAPHDGYGCLLGQVTAIDKLGTPEHDTENPDDDVHVNFFAFDYPPRQRRGFAERFSELYGGEYHDFHDLPLDDVIISPDSLINLTGLSEKAINGFVTDYEAAEEFCEEVMREYSPEREAELIERINKNYTDYRNSLMNFSAFELIGMAGKIQATKDAYFYLTQAHEYDVDEIGYFLEFQNPLEVLANEWHRRTTDLSDMDFAMEYVYEHSDTILEQYPLMQNVVTPEQAVKSAAPPSQKQSLLGKLAGASAEAAEYNARNAQKPKTPENSHKKHTEETR